jgi:hypothetical protein
VNRRQLFASGGAAVIACAVAPGIAAPRRLMRTMAWPDPIISAWIESRLYEKHDIVFCPGAGQPTGLLTRLDSVRTVVL